MIRRHVPAGVSIEPPYTPLDEDGGVAFAEDAAVRLRAWLPADGAASRDAVRSLRRELRSLGDDIVRPLRARKVDDASWAEAWKRHFLVLRVGRRLVIRPSWRRYRPRRDDIVIQLDPGMAFGTGHHETTRLSLAALEERLVPKAQVLDVGCGSGILAIAAALLGAKRVDALDLDPAAVRATQENSAVNAVERKVRAAYGSLGAAWPFRQRPVHRYDLVLANISSRVIKDLAPHIVNALRPDGIAILSGLVEAGEPGCRRALRKAGGRVVESRGEGDWRLLVCARRDEGQA